MSGKKHSYTLSVIWTGNTGAGTASYTGYSRDHVISSTGKPDLPGSSDPAFRGDVSRYNPEHMLVAAISSCHMLWYLHLASEAGVIVVAYRDDPVGVMVEDKARGGYFTGVTLKPTVTIAAGNNPNRARAVHDDAHAKCFVAKSVNFPVTCEPTIVGG